jgi:ABC-type uncharacterized transport system ATPase subunit
MKHGLVGAALLVLVLGGTAYVSSRPAERAGPLTASGTIEADEVVVAAEVSGRIAALDVDEGASVNTGVTIVLTTHYIDEAEHADRVALLLGGRMVALAPPRELRETGLSGILLEVECEPAIDALRLLPEIQGVREVTLYGAVLHVLVEPELSADALRDRIRHLGVQVQAIRSIQPSLEDVFVSRIRGQP